MSPRRDQLTADLFRDYRPDPVVERFDPEEVKAWTLDGRLSKAIALTMDNAQLNREEIAAAMSEVLKTNISKAALDNYASQARETQISAVRLAALIEVTGDARALNVLLENSGLIVIPKKYEALLRREKARELNRNVRLQLKPESASTAGRGRLAVRQHKGPEGDWRLLDA